MGATPSVEAPEYDVFKPLDHPIWFESSQFFLDVRYEPFRERILSPYFGGDLAGQRNSRNIPDRVSSALVL